MDYHSLYQKDYGDGCHGYTRRFCHRVSEKMPNKYALVSDDVVQLAILLMAETGNVIEARKFLDDVATAWDSLKGN
jgi:hypothetical protein